MAEKNLVHECLFCPQRFDSAIAKDDHILSHFAQEICEGCNKNLIRIGRNLYTLHTEITCVNREWESQEDGGLNFDENYDEDISSKLTTILVEGQSNAESNVNHQNEQDSLEISENDWLKRESYPFEFGEHSILTTSQNEEESTTNTSDCMTQDTIESNYDETMLIDDVKPNFQSGEPENAHAWDMSHTHLDRKKETPNNANNRIECEICGQFFHKYALYRHKRDVHNPKMCICEICNTKFKSEEYLQRHMRSKHGASPKIFKCDTCNEVFRKETSLQFHNCMGIQVETNNDKSCDICQKVFTRKQTLQKHKVLFHSQSGTIYCNVCGRLFSTIGDRDSHQEGCALKKRIQHASNPIPCDICGKMLSRKGALQRHKNLVH